jgi:hypothetical protein
MKRSKMKEKMREIEIGKENRRLANAIRRVSSDLSEIYGEKKGSSRL